MIPSNELSNSLRTTEPSKERNDIDISETEWQKRERLHDTFHYYNTTYVTILDKL